MEDAPGLTVAKTIVSIGGTNVEDQQNIPDASVGDTIIYQIEVENTGNTVLENIRIEDTLGNDSLALYSDTACETAADSTITSLA